MSEKVNEEQVSEKMASEIQTWDVYTAPAGEDIARHADLFKELERTRFALAAQYEAGDEVVLLEDLNIDTIVGLGPSLVLVAGSIVDVVKTPVPLAGSEEGGYAVQRAPLTITIGCDHGTIEGVEVGYMEHEIDIMHIRRARAEDVGGAAGWPSPYPANVSPPEMFRKVESGMFVLPSRSAEFMTFAEAYGLGVFMLAVLDEMHSQRIKWGLERDMKYTRGDWTALIARQAVKMWEVRDQAAIEPALVRVAAVVGSAVLALGHHMRKAKAAVESETGDKK